MAASVEPLAHLERMLLTDLVLLQMVPAWRPPLSCSMSITLVEINERRQGEYDVFPILRY